MYATNFIIMYTNLSSTGWGNMHANWEYLFQWSSLVDQLIHEPDVVTVLTRVLVVTLSMVG